MPMTGAPEWTRSKEQHTVDDGAEEVGWLEKNSAGVDEDAMNNTQAMRKVCISAHGNCSTGDVRIRRAFLGCCVVVGRNIQP
jgi:hypothetical protein